MAANFIWIFYISKPIFDVFSAIEMRILFVFKNTMCMYHKIKAMPVGLTDSYQPKRNSLRESPRAF
jgi:hypothetical protein